MKLKKKFKIPKYAPGGYMTTGDTVQLADSNMLQGYDSGLSSIPDYSQQQTGMSTDAKVGMAGGIMGGIGSATPSKVELTAEQQGLEKGKDQLAQSNPFIGMFRGIEKMANGIGGAIGGKKGEETMRSITDPFQNGLGSIHNKNLTAGQKALQFLPFGNFALPEMDKRFDKQFETKNKGSNLNFGNVVEMALGGLVTNSSSKDFKQFNTESHEEGGQFIDKNKNPTNDQSKAVAEIEKKENSYKDYIFSDTLLYKNDWTFAKQADKINRKYKDREDVISKNSLDIELTELMKKNEKQRQLAEEQNQNLLAQVQEFALGGMLNKRRNVNSFNDMMDNSFYSPDGKFFTSQEQYQKFQDLNYPQENISNLNPIINNYGKIKFKKNNFQFKNGGKVDPIYTDNPKDKRLQAYNDSLSLYKLGIEGNKLLNNPSTTEDIWKKYVNQFYNTDGTINKNNKYNQAGTRLTKLNGKPVIPEKISNERNFGNGYTGDMQMYKKPVQPIIYKKKEEVKVPIPKKKFAFPDEQEGNEESYQAWRKTLPKNLQYEGDYDLKGFYKDNPNFKAEDKNQHLTDKYKLPNHPTFSVESKYYKEGMPAGKWEGDNYVPINRGNPLPDYLTQTVKTPNGMKIYKRKDTNSTWIEQFDKGGSIKTPNPRNIKSIEYQEWLKKVPEEYRNEQNYYTGDLLDNKIVPTNKDIGTLDNYKTGEKLREDYIKKGIFLPRSQSGLIDKFSYPFFEMNDKMKMGGKIKKYETGGKLDPSDPDYFTKLMQQNNILNYGNIGPVEDRSNLGPLNKSKFNTTTNDNSEAKSDYEFYKPGQVGTPIVKGVDGKNKPSALEIAGYGIKGAELLGHAIQAFKKPDLVNPVYNPEENAIKGIMKNRSVDVQSILNELDLQEAGAKQNIANNSTSVGVMQANLQKLNANNVNAIAKTKFDESLQNNQYRADEAQVLNNLGQQKVVAQNYAEDLNARAKGNVQNQRDKFLKESIGGLGDFLLKKDYVNKENQFQENILKAKGINFGPTSYKTWNKAGINIVEFAGELESESDKAKRETLKAENKKKYLAAGGTEASWNAEIHELENKYLTK